METAAAAATDMSEPATCTAVTGPIWKLDGESCACVRPAVHVFDPATDEHRCTCGAWWYDDLQVAEAQESAT